LSAADDPWPWRRATQGLLLDLRVTPRASREGPDGIATRDDGRPVLGLRVRAAPTDGEANAAVIALVAKALRLPGRAVEIAAGASGRRKTLLLHGEPDDLGGRLRLWLAKAGSRPGPDMPA
jgi:uncharacterized protein (TIGR00251 family)